jgi:hypothetical protein
MRYIHSEERLPILDNGERLSFCEFGGLEGEAGRTQSLDPRTHSIFNNEKNIYPLEATTKIKIDMRRRLVWTGDSLRQEFVNFSSRADD